MKNDNGIIKTLASKIGVSCASKLCTKHCRSLDQPFVMTASVMWLIKYQSGMRQIVIHKPYISSRVRNHFSRSGQGRLRLSASLRPARLKYKNKVSAI